MSTDICLIDRGKDWDAIKQLIAKSPRSTPGSLASVEKERNSNSGCYITKAVDTTTNEIVGTSVWFIHTSQKQRGCWTGPTTRPHVYLYLIFTQRMDEGDRNAQSLMQWGLDRADSLGLEVWTYSSSPETPLYCGNGFTEIEEILTEYPPVWSLQRSAIDNRRVHKEAYISTHGFW
ncbi:hypothetical protein P171DRAFT_476416 [Karstenula rhodostoma CBS 690.94]|uniref:N-acetyltransferase domain-containing protein n=1 Tax=Karstenula rhodostoma CBS 690.94 TaxID=1392251 RepID=A0A9P4P9Z3_9PLEO|nr:hypothetical protein P171DRAFT_476416 [Karstenula rhodostoma CBS 690.94]